MRSISEIVAANLQAVVQGVPNTGTTGEAADPGHPWTVVIGFTGEKDALGALEKSYTVTNNTTGGTRQNTITGAPFFYNHGNADRLARALNLLEAR